MSQMKMLWLAIGLSLLGALLIWAGMFYADALLYIGLAVFAVGMVVGPLTRFIGNEDENGDDGKEDTEVREDEEK
jgi:hypothetical protein